MEDLEHRAKHCVTHHHACDCREWKHEQEVTVLAEKLRAWRDFSFSEVGNQQAIDKLRALGEIT